MTWYFGWLPQSGKHNVAVLGYFLCVSSSVKLGSGKSSVMNAAILWFKVARTVQENLANEA